MHRYSYLVYVSCRWHAINSHYYYCYYRWTGISTSVWSDILYMVLCGQVQ